MGRNEKTIKINPPIIFDGTTVYIPRASTTGDGYLAHEDFAKFLGGGVGVTLVDTGVGLTGGPITSSGTVSLTNTGVISGIYSNPTISVDDQGRIDAITAGSATFLPLAGGTMTGALMLSRDPQSSLEAATRGYVLAHASGASLLPGTYLVTDYAASGSKQQFIGSINSGSTSLTTTATTDFQVGQGIFIANATTTGPLVTTVAAISGTAITLQDPATATATSRNVQHDDTAAIQAAINDVWTRGSGTILFPPGYYRINKGFTSTNSILTVPMNSVNSPSKCIALKGYVPNGFLTFTGGVTEAGAVVIQTDLIGTSSAMIAGAPFANNSYASTNNTCIWLESMIWRTYDNPQINAIDLGMFGQYVFLKEICVDAGQPMKSAAEPTYGTFGIRMPGTTACTVQKSDNAMVNNYAIGMIASEIMHSVNTMAFRCKTGLQLIFGWHLLSGRFLMFHCPKLIDFTSPTYPSFIDFHLDLEPADSSTAPAWAQPLPNGGFYDPNNTAYGKISYTAPKGGDGTAVDVGITGLAHVDLVNYGSNSRTGPAVRITGNVDNQNVQTVNLKVGNNFSLWDGSILEKVSFGANDSATAGYRWLRVPNPSASTLNTGLVSYWKMDEPGLTDVRVDQLAHNNFTPIGHLIASAPGVIAGSNSTYAPSITNYLTCYDSSFQGFAGPMTIAGWFKIHILDAGTHAYPTLLSKWDNTIPTGLSFLLIYNNASGKWQFSLSADGHTSVDCLLAATPVIDSWYFICARFDSAAGLMRLSINAGTPVTQPFTGPIFHAPTPLQVFTFQGIYQNDAYADELGLWSRSLSDAEVTILYNSNNGLTYPF
jgi:hypothetical protein